MPKPPGLSLFHSKFKIQHLKLSPPAQQAEHAEAAEKRGTGLRDGADDDVIDKVPVDEPAKTIFTSSDAFQVNVSVATVFPSMMPVKVTVVPASHELNA